MSLTTAYEAAVQVVFFASIAFVAAVSLFWPWWRSQLGWTITAKSLALAVAVFPACLAFWTSHREPIGLLWVSVVALFTVPLILGWRAIVIFQIQRHGTEKELR